uniref:carboxylate--amine ligase n=1 Tax=Flavobacterium sp. TaxID=239 RepID=UPI0040499A39
MKNVAVVLGSYVNGYEVIRELHSFGVQEIILLDNKKSLGAFSNKIKYFEKFQTTSQLISKIILIANEYDKVVLFPTSDEFTELLYESKVTIPTNCFIPFNTANFTKSLTKKHQYKICEAIDIPFPKTIFLENVDDLEQLKNLPLPFLLKPSVRVDEKLGFRNKVVRSIADLEPINSVLTQCLREGIEFLASEIIPGDGSKVYAYNAYRNKKGSILNEWTGRKLAQYPNDFGVFASASSTTIEEDLEIKTLGRKLINYMDLYGYVEPEFKFDLRDSKYKLMEINIRPMMWHKLGFLSGIPLNYIHWCDILHLPVPEFQLNNKEKIHYVYLQYEIINLLTRKGYFKTFRSNVFSKNKVVLAVLDIKDIKPFIFDLYKLIQRLFLLLLNGGKPVNKHSSIVKKIKSIFK